MQIVLDQKVEAFVEHLASQNLMLKVKNGELLLKSNAGKLNPSQIALNKKDNSIIDFIKNNKQSLIKVLQERSKSMGPVSYTHLTLPTILLV